MISFLKHPLTSNQVSKHAKLNNLEIKIMQYVSTNVNTELSYKEDFYSEHSISTAEFYLSLV